MTVVDRTDREFPAELEAHAAQLAAAAYAVVLRHGVQGSFVDLELALWREIREVLARNDCPTVLPSGEVE
jgi:hypothetical protein